jgi:hypothetical protein
MRMRSARDATAQPLEGAHQTVEIAQRMELRLPRKAQCPSRVESGNRCACHDLRVDQAGARRGLVLALDLIAFIARRREEVAIQAPEFAADAFVGDDPLDRVDRGRMALVGLPRAVLAVRALEHVKAIVDGALQMRRRSACHATANRSVVDDHDAVPLTRKQIRGRHTGDARAHDADIGSLVAIERRPSRDRVGRGPNRFDGMHERNAVAMMPQR